MSMVTIMEKEKLSKNLIKKISKIKQEPKWMLDFRLQSYEAFLKLDLPKFGPTLDINFDDITYYKSGTQKTVDDWNQVDNEIRDEFSKLGVIDAEEKYLSGVANQFESEVVYHKLSDDSQEGVIFLSSDQALKQFPDLFKQYFNSLVKYDENKFTALNGALWSGGSFIYIPPNIKLDRPLQSYFRINSASLGQFERTIIIVDEGADLSYIEGCTATTYSTTSLHAGVVEIFVLKNAKCRYTTIQNWSADVYNLVTKRSVIDDHGVMEWIDGNLGSKITMKYPSCILRGDYSIGNSISIAYAKKDQYIDAGAKMIHLGKHTKSNIVAKSIATDNGVSNYRGTSKIGKMASNSEARVKCDTILLHKNSSSNTYPKNILGNQSSTLEHEATISKVSEDKLFYLQSKGLSEEMATELLIMGLIDDFKKELPMEYAVELNRLIKNI